MHWTDQLHRALIAISDLVNRVEVDAQLLAASDVKLDRALFPLLARVAMHEKINVAELANLVGRDHSTVSRQVVKLVQLGFLDRVVDPIDQRSRQLALSQAGNEIMTRIDHVRQQWMEDHFAQWSEADRDALVALMSKMIGQGYDFKALATGKSSVVDL